MIIWILWMIVHNYQLLTEYNIILIRYEEYEVYMNIVNRYS